MFCPKCGTQNPEDGKFCRRCGTDLSPVSDALAGKSNNQTPDFLMMSPRQMRNRQMQMFDKKGKSVSWESAFGKLFTGIAFFVISIALASSAMGTGWWFWMLIPAFGAIGSGLAQIFQLKRDEGENILPPAPETKTNDTFAPVSNVALPQMQNDYTEPQKSIYDTGELAAPPSVTEGTTRHLEVNNEGETMTLPPKK